jgi:hypothetical protein
MKVLDFPQTLPERIAYLLEPVLTRQTPRELLSEAERVPWQELMEKQLSSWARNPEQLGDEGIVAPSGGMVQLAIDVARVLRDQSVEVPDRVVPNGDGGVVFRWRSGDFTWSLELDADGSMETSLMEHDSLVCRHSLHAEPSR